MTEKFFPGFKNVEKIYKEKCLEISLEDQKEMKNFERNMNSCFIVATMMWIGIFAVDFKRFLLKNYPIIVKLPRIKYHLASAFLFAGTYNVFDLYFGMHAIKILSKYDKKFAALMMRT